MTERVHVFRDSYDYYGLTDGEGGAPVDVDEGTAKHWREALAAFEAVQDEMQAAYDEDRKKEAAAAEVRNAERAVAEAQARLDQLRFDLQHPLDDPTSWPAGDPQPIECRGRRFASEPMAWVGRLGVYDTVLRCGGRIVGWDLAPYTCTDGHWHLGRTS